MIYFLTLKSALEKKGYEVELTSYNMTTKSNVICAYKAGYSVAISEYPHCCGSFVLSEMWSESLDIGIDCTKDLLKIILNSESMNFATYITMEAQYSITKVLEGVGFSKLDDFRNANTGNLCSLWSINSTKI